MIQEQEENNSPTSHQKQNFLLPADYGLKLFSQESKCLISQLEIKGKHLKNLNLIVDET